MNGFLRFWGPVCAYAALIFYVSSQSHPEEQVPFVTLFSDKVVHAVEYALLGALCCRAFQASRREAWRRQAILLAIVFTSLYGISDEIHQSFVPFRESSAFDWVADTIGAAVGAAGFSRISQFVVARARLV
ncbi:MAG: VanZ family protein [Nitrospira sp.]|nr:VanZ family protein [Nitrospira sp.]MDH4305341.1 VanZ family protein [Nitrospira sp.]MDH5194612.1 VanZ family protein [Nitrospira sp.]